MSFLAQEVFPRSTILRLTQDDVVTAVPEKLPITIAIILAAFVLVCAASRNGIKKKSDCLTDNRVYEVLYGNTILAIACVIFGFVEHPSAIGRFVHRECILFYVGGVCMALNIMFLNWIVGTREFLSKQ